MKQSVDQVWGELNEFIELCVLPMMREDLESKFGIEFYNFTTDGIGEFCVSEVEIKGSNFFLVSLKDSSRNTLEKFNYDNVLVLMGCRTSYPNKLLTLLLNDLDLKISDLLWCCDDLGPAQWSLHRLDDNNNEIEMFRYLHERCAETAKRIFDEKGHKQAYFVKHQKAEEINQ